MLSGTPLVARLHVDLKSTCSALCS